MALPVYATTAQRIGYYSFLTYCGLVFFFLISPIFIVLPLSFSSSPFFEFTREFMTLDPSGWSLKWYKQMLNICGIEVTTVCTDKWMRGTVNSFYIGIVSTFLATGLGTVAALGLSSNNGNLNFTNDCSFNYYRSRNVFLLFKIRTYTHIYRFDTCAYCSGNTFCGNYSYRNPYRV